MRSRMTYPLGQLGLVVLGVLAAWAIIRGIQEEPAIVGSLATAASAILVAVIGRAHELRLELQQKHREMMAPVYEKFIERVKDPEKWRESSGEEFYRGLQTSVLLRGAAPVIAAMNRFNQDPAADQEEPLLMWEEVLRAIRRDLGHDDSRLDRGDLLKIYIKPEEVDEMLTHSSGRSGRV